MKQKTYLVFSLITFLAFTVISCSKDTPVKTPEQLLSGKPWKIQEISGVRENAVINYKRGGSSNTESFDNEYILFQSDHSGTYHENNGLEHPLNWNFNNTEKTLLNIVVQFNPVTTLTWNNVKVTESSLKYDEFYQQKGVNSHTSAERIH